MLSPGLKVNFFGTKDLAKPDWTDREVIMVLLLGDSLTLREDFVKQGSFHDFGWGFFEVILFNFFFGEYFQEDELGGLVLFLVEVES